MGNTLRSYSHKSLFLILIFQTHRNDYPSRQNRQEAQPIPAYIPFTIVPRRRMIISHYNRHSLPSASRNDYELRRNENRRERRPTIIPNNSIFFLLFPQRQVMASGVPLTIPYVPIPYIPIPNYILLPEVRRGWIFIPNNTGIIQFLISRATSANQIIFIDSGQGYISDVVLTPPGQRFLGPRPIEHIIGTILPSNLNRDTLGQNCVTQNVAGSTVLVPNVSTVIVTVLNLQGEGHLITHSSFWVFGIFYSVDDLGAPPGRSDDGVIHID